MNRRLFKSTLLIALVFAEHGAFAGAQTGQAARPATTGIAGRYAISGVVVSAESNLPLSHADVMLQSVVDGKLIAQITTGEDGTFLFKGLAVAKYALRASHRGYISSLYDEHSEFSTAIVTGEGLASNGLTFRLPPQAVLSGTVTDDFGDAVAQASVSLYRQDKRNGTGNIVRAQQTTTDDTGAFEVSRLEPGDYYLAVTARPWYATHPSPRRDAQGQEIGETARSPLDVAYPRTFYADVTDSNLATPIPVKAGDRVTVNFSLHAVPAVHISQLISRGREDGANRGFSMPQIQQESFGIKEPLPQTMSMTTGPNGATTMELGGIAPGDYQVEVHSPNGVSTAAVSATGDVKLDELQSTPMADVFGKVAMANGEKLPDGLGVYLHTGDNSGGAGGGIDKDGNFTLRGVAPGNYELGVFSQGTPLWVEGMSATGAVVEGHILKVESQPINLAATLVEGLAVVSGFARRGQNAAPGVLVLLVPGDSHAAPDLYRRDQSDSDGSFTMNRVVPGQYTLVAIEDGWSLDWARYGVMAKYLAQGVKVVVPAHTKEVRTPAAVQVQAK